jgi:2-polyprenyl-6-methoxyphenol hydroxylase-like FAD-dependent oxidoreductase
VSGRRARRAGSSEHVTDVVIVGAGLAGATAAVLLGRAGIGVTLIDPKLTYPDSFKAEKIEEDQAKLLRRFRLLDALRSCSASISHVVLGGGGRRLDLMPIEQYGIFYQDLVNAVRRQISPTVEIRIGRVLQITMCGDGQRVRLEDGHTIGARLVVLASGTAGQLLPDLALKRRIVRKGHSFSCGFSVRRVDGHPFPFEALTYFAERVDSRIGFISLFAMPNHQMRVNLFTYWQAKDDQVRRFAASVEEELRRLLPRLEVLTGAFETTGKVEMCPTDLYTVEGYLRPGTVLIGDAFQTSCPATGTGLSKVLNDVDVLCSECLPQWLATPGMGVEKIARFYDHPQKTACDTQALQGSLWLHRLHTDRSLPWRLRRQRLHLQRRLAGWRRRLGGAAPGDQRSSSIEAHAAAWHSGREPSNGV